MFLHIRTQFDCTIYFQEGERVEFDPVSRLLISLWMCEGKLIVTFHQGLRVRGAVDEWLGHVEQGMFAALKRCMRVAYRSYHNKDRSLWFQDHANQIVLTISQEQWANDVHNILDGDRSDIPEKMRNFKLKMGSDLNKLTAIARSDITSLVRKVLCALITIDVHAMEMISNMIKENVTDS